MFVTRNSPRAAVYTVTGAPGPFTITDTPGSTPPCSSTTFPMMAPVEDPNCANTALGTNIVHTSSAIADTIHENRFGIKPSCGQSPLPEIPTLAGQPCRRCISLLREALRNWSAVPGRYSNGVAKVVFARTSLVNAVACGCAKNSLKGVPDNGLVELNPKT